MKKEVKRDDEKRRDRSRSRSKKQKKKHRRRHSSSSSSSSNNDVFDALLESKRLEKLEQKRLEKKRLKELETPEEKRARRLAKKQLKEEKRRMEMASSLPEGIPYTDHNNPFNDMNLTEAFIWKKKLESEGMGNLSKEKAEKLSHRGIQKNLAEMELLKRNREQREATKEDLEMIERDVERRKGSEWRKTEDSFQLKQARLRMAIRIKEDRAEPIDLLSRYIQFWNYEQKEIAESPGDFELVNPLTYIKKCSVDDYENLLNDIKTCRAIDGAKNNNFWDDIDTIVRYELKKIHSSRKQDSNDAIHSTVKEDIMKIIKNKSYDELHLLEGQVKTKIKNASRGTDISYWENLIELLRPHMARQRIEELHRKVVQLKLKRIREEQSKEMAKHEADIEFAMPSTSIKTTTEIEDEASILPPIPFAIDEFENMNDEEKDQSWQTLEKSGQTEQFSFALYEHGRYSPPYGGNESQIMPGIEILDENEDRLRISQQRKEKFKKPKLPEKIVSAKEQQMMEIAKRGMTEDETLFSEESAITDQQYLWSDKYRPRKPGYLNRVHTGFDWNKYNQTHYDIDNPPPKIVQGYRFNIFYPDLLDATQAPTFSLIKCDNPDFAIIRFKAGPPYEDIAFKIVNREWEINYKHGYRCQFQDGIFQLWFFFKRYRYRR